MRITPKGRLSPYKEIELSLRTRVQEGQWPSGTPLPGRRRLALEYGVALSTIQRAITTLLEDGTLQTDGHFGTFVASSDNPGLADVSSYPSTQKFDNPESFRLSDHSVRSSKSLTVGIVYYDGVPQDIEGQFENPFFGPLSDGIRSQFAREDIYLSYFHKDAKKSGQAHSVTNSDGYLFIAPIAQKIWDLRRAYAENVPYVALLTSADSMTTDLELPCVDADNRGGACQAVSHLVELGHKEIAIVDLALSQTNFSDRLVGYLQAMGDFELTINPNHLQLSSYPWNDLSFLEQTEPWLTKLQRTNNLPTAIFCCDFQMALITLNILQMLGIRVPEDVSLVGFDDNAVAEHTKPPLTVVRQPLFQIGRRAAERLIEHLRHSQGHLSGTEKLQTELIVRASTAPPRQK